MLMARFRLTDRRRWAELELDGTVRVEGRPAEPETRGGWAWALTDHVNGGSFVLETTCGNVRGVTLRQIRVANPHRFELRNAAGTVLARLEPVITFKMGDAQVRSTDQYSLEYPIGRKYPLFRNVKCHRFGCLQLRLTARQRCWSIGSARIDRVMVSKKCLAIDSSYATACTAVLLCRDWIIQTSD